MSESEASDFVVALRAGVGHPGGSVKARDPVNQAMIRHWCDAMQDHNPVHVDPDFAAKSVHGEIVAPPAMLNAWTMQGLLPRHLRPTDAPDPSSTTYGRLDAAGYTSVVATNSEHEYVRYLRLGDDLTGHATLKDVSEEKHTGLGIGHFVTTETEYRNQDDEVVGRMLFRILKFKPGTGRAVPSAGEGGKASEQPQRPLPGISKDTQFFWDGLEEGELRIQQCNGCQALHHPPMVRCPQCGRYDLGYRVASGRGRVYSCVEPVHPPFPTFDPPYVAGLVELEEGTRLLTNIVDIDPDKVEIGMPVELTLQKANNGMTLPLFRPIRPARNETTLRYDEVEEGMELSPCPIPLTPTLIVSTAIASRDYQDVHHDRDLAIKRGSPDIFMNILTTSGLCSRYVTDWAGPEAILRRLAIRLGVPNYPYDTMTMSAQVTQKRPAGQIQITLRGYNHLGNHVTGTIDVELPT